MNADEPTKQEPVAGLLDTHNSTEKAKPRLLKRWWMPRRPRTPKQWILLGLLTVFLFGLSVPTSLGLLRLYHVYTFVQSSTNQSLPKVAATAQVPTATPLPDDLAGLDHLNLLLLGSDSDTKFAGGRVLTQTDMVVRIDLRQHHVTMLSLPRDLWVPTDTGVCCAKLDEISLNETDGAKTPLQAKLHGFAHTVATIEADFHIPINAYAWVGLDGFINVINTLGGVDIDVLHPVVDDAYPNDIGNGDPYAYQRLYIPAGPQHLDGKTALEFVRSRHADLLEDVGRTARQQAVLLALKKKLDDPTILNHLDSLAADMQGSVLTSLSIRQVAELANFARGLTPHDFSQYVLGLPDYGYGALVDTADGTKWVEEPRWDVIHQFIQHDFPESRTPTSHNLQYLSTIEQQTVHMENARVLIENGSGRSGIGNALMSILRRDGFTVVGVRQANHTYLASQVENFNPQTEGTSRVLSQLFGVLSSTPTTSAPSGVDIMLMVGQDSVPSIQASSG